MVLPGPASSFVMVPEAFQMDADDGSLPSEGHGGPQEMVFIPLSGISCIISYIVGRSGTFIEFRP